MSTRFSTLPSDCVQLIFDRISTQNLLEIRRVSRAWQGHQQLNCRARKSLIIVQREVSLDGFHNKIYNQPFIEHNIDHNGNPRNYKSFIEHNEIIISYTTTKTLKYSFLIETFSHLHSLIVYTNRTLLPYLRSFVRLITHYSSQLVTLQFYFDGVIRNSNQETSVCDIMRKFTNKLNSFTSLRHLTFHIEPYYQSYFEFNRSTNWQINEPEFLTRIKEIYFNFRSVEKVMLDWVRKYDKAGRLSQLERFYFELDLKSRGIAPGNKFYQYPLSNLYSFVPCEIRLFIDIEEHLKRIVEKFPSLTTITYTLNQSINSLTKLSTILSPLTKLVHCKLNVEVVVASNELFNPNSHDKLASIKALDLEFKKESDFQDFCQSQAPTIVLVFTNLQSVQIINREKCDSVLSQNTLKQIAKQFFDEIKVAYDRKSLRTEYYL